MSIDVLAILGAAAKLAAAALGTIALFALPAWAVTSAAFWWSRRARARKAAATEKPAPCQCPLCQAKRNGATQSLPADFAASLNTGVALVGTGKIPAAVLQVDIAGPDGIGKVNVIAMDGALWDRVARPAVEKHLQERAGGKAS